MLELRPLRMNLQLFAADTGEDGGGTEPQPPAQPTPPTPSAKPTEPGQKLFTEDYVKSLRGEAAENRVKYQALKRAVQETFGVELQGDPNDVLGQIKTDFEQQVQATRKSVQQMHLSTAATALQAELNIVDLEAALKLADLTEVNVTDEGKVEGLKEALEAVLEAKPYLRGQVTPASRGALGGNPPRGQNLEPDGVAEAVAIARKRNQRGQIVNDPWARGTGAASQAGLDADTIVNAIAQALLKVQNHE